MSDAKPFLEIDRRPITAEEYAARLDPYVQQQELIGLLEGFHAHAKEVLSHYGYPCNASLRGLRPDAEITEPEALEAADVIDAVGNVWRAMFRDDKAQLANAAFWLGALMGPEAFRRFQGRKRRGKQAESRKQLEWRVRLIYERMLTAGRPVTYVTLMMASRDAQIEITDDQSRRLLAKFRS